MRPDDWPSNLRHLVGTYGAGAVWQGGMKLFGYPPTWDIGGGLINQLTRYLQEQKQ